MCSCDISVQQLINIEHFQDLKKKYDIIILCFIHNIHTQKHQMYAEQGNKEKL